MDDLNILIKKIKLKIDIFNIFIYKIKILQLN